MPDSPWLDELRRRTPGGRLMSPFGSLFADDTGFFARALERTDWYYVVGLENGHTWQCTGLQLAHPDGDVVRLLRPKLLYPPADMNVLAGVEIRIDRISWIAESSEQLP